MGSRQSGCGGVAGLVDTHRVVAPDLPAHGTSGVAEGRHDVARVVAWLDELVAGTCESPPVLVGQMFGGAIAARYATGHSDRISGLVLVDAFGLGRFRPAPRTVLAVTGFLARPTIRSHTRLVQQLTSDLEALRRHWGELAEPLEEYCVVRTRAAGARSAQNDLMRHFAVAAIPPADLARIAVPTHLIWGSHDAMVRLAVPYIEQPEAFLAVLRTATALGSRAAPAEREPYHPGTVA